MFTLAVKRAHTLQNFLVPRQAQQVQKWPSPGQGQAPPSAYPVQGLPWGRLPHRPGVVTGGDVSGQVALPSTRATPKAEIRLVCAPEILAASTGQRREYTRLLGFCPEKSGWSTESHSSGFCTLLFWRIEPSPPGAAPSCSLHQHPSPASIALDIGPARMQQTEVGEAASSAWTCSALYKLRPWNSLLALYNADRTVTVRTQGDGVDRASASPQIHLGSHSERETRLPTPWASG